MKQRELISITLQGAIEKSLGDRLRINGVFHLILRILFHYLYKEKQIESEQIKLEKFLVFQTRKTKINPLI